MTNDLRQIIAAAAVKPASRERIPVATPFWPDTDGKLFLRMPTAAERIQPYKPQSPTPSPQPPADDDDGLPYWAKLLAVCLCDAEGAPVFGDSDAQRAEGAKLLAGQPAPIGKGLLEVWGNLIDFALPDLRETAKNSETSRSASSPTGSPPTSESPTSKTPEDS